MIILVFCVLRLDDSSCPYDRVLSIISRVQSLGCYTINDDCKKSSVCWGNLSMTNDFFFDWFSLMSHNYTFGLWIKTLSEVRTVLRNYFSGEKRRREKHFHYITAWLDFWRFRHRFYEKSKSTILTLVMHHRLITAFWGKILGISSGESLWVVWTPTMELIKQIIEGNLSGEFWVLMNRLESEFKKILVENFLTQEQS